MCKSYHHRDPLSVRTDKIKSGIYCPTMMSSELLSSTAMHRQIASFDRHILTLSAPISRLLLFYSGKETDYETVPRCKS